MKVKNELLDQLAEARVNFRSVLEGADPDREVSPGWTIREVLAHISGWDLVTGQALRSYQQRTLYLLETMDIDACNREMVETRQGYPFPEVVAEWEKARRSLLEAAGALDENDFQAELMFPWGEEGTLKEMLEIIIGHELEHAEEIQRMKV